ncbi:MAG: hypothetical protein U1F67_25325 [Rubrivivax sp.]
MSGPERIEAGWWDGPPAVRDYFIALAADGSLVWIWRRRLAALTARRGRRRNCSGCCKAGSPEQWTVAARRLR